MAPTDKQGRNLNRSDDPAPRRADSSADSITSLREHTVAAANEREAEPRCTCHGEPMRWAKDTRRRAGGRWRCAEYDREWKRNRYDGDPMYRMVENFKRTQRRRRALISAYDAERGWSLGDPRPQHDQPLFQTRVAS